MKKLLVTGGAGFIGSNFVRYILSDFPEYSVIVLDKLTYAGNLENLAGLAEQFGTRYHFVYGDICDSQLVNQLTAGCYGIVNFAAETHVDRSIINAGSFVQTDVYGTYVLLESARMNNIELFLQISTDEVYGEAPGRPSREDDALMPKSPYAASKCGADRLAYSYYTTYNMPVIITRCTNNFGPYQHPEKLIPLFISNLLENKPVPVYGSGKNTRDWIYVEDHCRALALFLDKGKQYAGEVFNIGSGTEKSVLDITETLIRILNKSCELIQFVVDRPGHVQRHAVDTTKLRTKFGWQPETDFTTGLEKTINWYVTHQMWWRKIKEKNEEYRKFYEQNYIQRDITFERANRKT
ncbi:MAG: dTDP-glucose 4,6-dehydratase [bacterium]|nr:dTDP-glucose 4,6-dehydratase [bacterium]